MNTAVLYQGSQRTGHAMVDEYEFFMNATLRICRHLDIAQGLQDCRGYLAEHMPADRLILERYEPDQGAMRIIVDASAAKAEKVDFLIPLPETVKTGLDKAIALAEDQLPRVLVYDGKDDSILHAAMLEKLGMPRSSTMVIPLVIKDRFAGYVALHAEGVERYEPGHERLFATLKEPFFIALSNTLEHEEVVTLKDRLADDNRYLNEKLLEKTGTSIIGADFGLAAVMRLVSQVAPTDSAVMLTGETGVGKDVIANAIHLGSPRRDGPFIAVNCGAIPQSLIDSELFGHEKGAFTGALATKRGRFERADGGTILLDEIGDMPLEAQVRLLRILQNREIERVGGVKSIPVDTRIIAATNKDLQVLVREGTFREDLFYRLNVFPIQVPPLRERSGDIAALVQHFIKKKAEELKIGEALRLAPGAIDVLMAYDWPGNVRELQNVVERAMILCRGEPLRFDDLASASIRGPREKAPGGSTEVKALDAVVANHIRGVLDEVGGKISGPGGAAELLGLNPNTLRDRMKKLGIRFQKSRNGT